MIERPPGMLRGPRVPWMRAGRRALLAMACVLAIGATLAACGDDESGSQDGAGATAPSAGEGASDGEAATAPAESATVKIRELPGYGPVLATTSGRPLHVLVADDAGSDGCADKCSDEWRPLIERGAPTAGPDVDPSLLSTTELKGGNKQVTYRDNALYTHKGPGLVSGAGVESDGGTWYLVSPTGDALLGTAVGGY